MHPVVYDEDPILYVPAVVLGIHICCPTVKAEGFTEGLAAVSAEIRALLPPLKL